jgi:hypothetical protein
VFFNFVTNSMTQYSIDQAQKSSQFAQNLINSESEFIQSLDSGIKQHIFGPLFLPVPNDFRGITFDQIYTPTCGLPLSS